MARTEDEKRAQAQYMREYRKRNPSKMKRQQDRDAARKRAFVRLSLMFPTQFATLFEEELKKPSS